MEKEEDGEKEVINGKSGMEKRDGLRGADDEEEEEEDKGRRMKRKDSLLEIGVRNGTMEEEKTAPPFSPPSQLFAQQINASSPSTSPSSCSSSCRRQKGEYCIGKGAKGIGKKVIRKLVTSEKADKSVQAALDVPGTDWRRELLLVADEEGADIWEWRGQMDQPSSQQGMPTPKSILKQSSQQPPSIQQQTTSQYTLQNAGSETGDGHQYWEDRSEIGLRVETDEQRAMVEQMQRNLALHRQPSPRQQSRYPAVPYDGPFFRLHEISPDGRSSRQIPVHQPGPSAFHHPEGGVIPPPPPPPPPPGWTPMRASMQRNGTTAQGATAGGGGGQQEEEGGRVVYWPPLNQGQPKMRPEVPAPKNVRDPERLEEFLRQERQQQEAEMVKNEREEELRERQMRAIHQQQQLLVQQQQNGQMGTNVAYSPNDQYQYGTQSDPGFGGRPGTSQQSSHHNHSLPAYPLAQPSPRSSVRVFEARPLSAIDTDYAFANGGSGPSPTTWRRTYILDARRAEQIDERNEILTSEERLVRERFDIDLLKRRESFIEKPEKAPEIKRLGRRWQPPPEKPYRWPSASPGPGAILSGQFPSPISIQTNSGVEHRWTPIVQDPGFKGETKQFTPEPSPPDSPIRGHGTGPLDDVARRQTAGLILPSPDGSHRPKSEFSRVRQPPSGGFVPHAPNAVRVVRRRKATNGEGDEAGGRESGRQTAPPPDEEYDYLPTNGEGRVLNNHHGHIEQQQKHRRRQSLPRHSSTIVQLEPLPRVEVRRRIKLLETRSAQSERSRSAVPRSRGARSPSAQRSLERIQRLTAASPAPESYKRAKRYLPPALPPFGINQNMAQNGQAGEQVPARHTRRMADAIQNAAQGHHQNGGPLATKMAAPEGNGKRRGEEEVGRRENGRGEGRWTPVENGRMPGMVGRPTDGGKVRSYRAERTVEHRRYTKKE